MPMCQRADLRGVWWMSAGYRDGGQLITDSLFQNSISVLFFSALFQQTLLIPAVDFSRLRRLLTSVVYFSRSNTVAIP